MSVCVKETRVAIVKSVSLMGLLVMVLTGCTSSSVVVPEHNDKIHIDHLAELNAQGLYGPADGLRSLSYEFCIPREQHYADAVRAIDPTIMLYSSSGRIGCGNDERLCVGHTAQPNHKEVLNTLARQPYIARIEETWFE